MIGNWDNSNCIFAILPKCLQKGDNPPPISTGTLTVYNGPKATENHYVDFDGSYLTIFDDNVSKMSGNAMYNSGTISQVGTSSPGYEIKASETFKKFFDKTTDLTLEYWINNVPYAGKPTYITTSWHFNNNYPDLAAGKFVFSSLINASDGTNANKFTFRLGGSSSVNPLGHTLVRKVSNVTSALSSEGPIHFVMTKNQGDFDFYVNGVYLGVETSQDWEDSTHSLGDGYVSQGVGTNNPTYVSPFSSISSMILYDGVLSSEQILENYSLGADLGGLYGFDG